ncbi:anti-sigma factor antagonist [Knoellia sinensis KCTC 19936]|uniref:Anti-sigma factor antagonist n=1 Tax=Knoellia sinensis KCTC 19936 TaxID=1385520 RepID=A0A0A0JFN5_9MICO|nr:STAS domain-containing protein [Knoellia sinensis]KGN34887.1 anti-sigma factor antagonist [Knoellia sinensis KCTC 19936]
MTHPVHTLVTLDERRDTTGHHVSLRGRLDIHTVPDLRLVLHRIVDDGSDDLLLDLAECEIGDATGFGVIVECLRRARRGSRTFCIVEADQRTRRLLHRARLAHVVGQTESADGAAVG